MANAAVNQKGSSNASSIFPLIVVPVAFVVALLIFWFVFGDPTNFKNNDPSGEPVVGGYKQYLGTIYKGGFVVPILLTQFLLVIIFVIERFWTLSKAAGAGNVDKFIKTVNDYLGRGDINAALAACDKQKGSVANVVRNGLVKYAEMKENTTLDKDQKVLAIKTECEEATALELPMIEKNLPFLATIASVATLFGLFGTVLGMIRSFAALAHAGTPDASALATGISEALINTALGIGTSALAIIFYNIFTTRIDGMTYRIDEANFALTQTFASKEK